MTPEQFCYWFQGFAELGGNNLPTPEQWKSICEHLQTVFKKVTPPLKTDADLIEKLKKAAEEDKRERDIERIPYKEYPRWVYPGEHQTVPVPMYDPLSPFRVTCSNH